jgi:hypothetical protein
MVEKILPFTRPRALTEGPTDARIKWRFTAFVDKSTK